MRLSITLMVAIIVAAFVLSGCGGGPRITRTQADQQVDLSGNWNASDSRQVANAMIADVMTRPWHSNFRQQHGENPRVQVDQVIVRGTGDYIDTSIFTNAMVREFINSGQVRALSDVEQRQRQQEVLEQLDGHADEDTRLNAFAQISPNFIMRGNISSQDDQSGRVRQRFYDINLELYDAETSELVWMGNHQISKVVERRR